MPLTESTVEEAALTWFSEVDYAVGHGEAMAPGWRTSIPAVPVKREHSS